MINRNEIFTRVVKVITSNYSVPVAEEKMTEETNLIMDLGFDSIKVLEMVVYLEEEFELEFTDESLVVSNLQTIGMITTTIANLIERSAQV